MARLIPIGILFLLAFSAPLHAGDPFNGHTIYGKHCLSCHGDSGRSNMVAVPDFSRGEGLFKADFMLIDTLKRGLGTMPAYQGLLTDSELADVITYIRTMQ